MPKPNPNEMKAGRDYAVLEPQPCPKCSYVMEGASCVTSEKVKPRPGDFGVCLNCGAFLVFDENLNQRLPTPEEDAMAKADPVLAFIHRQIKARGPLPQPEAQA